MQTTETLKLPWRLSEDAFKKFNQIIAEAIAASPNQYLVQSNANITQEARLRDAIASYEKYNWPSASFSREKFMDLRAAGKLKVFNKDGQIWIGSRHKVSTPDTVLIETLDFNDKISKDAILVASCVDFNQLKFLCHLASMRLLSHPVQVPKMDYDINYLQENFDVRVDDNGDGTITIL